MVGSSPKGSWPEAWRKTVFFVGYILSPLSVWNDAFVNIPIAYILANIAVRMTGCGLLVAVLVFYWLSNIAGIALMAWSGARIIGRSGRPIKELLYLVSAIVAYSLVLILLHHFNILKVL